MHNKIFPPFLDKGKNRPTISTSWISTTNCYKSS
uniref:Uncharacterized protein n=1 Tax=Setaria italica TaxID=4555 RepID=K3XTE9_SETIT